MRNGYEYYEGGIYKGMWKQNANGYYELYDSGGMSTGRIIKFN